MPRIIKITAGTVTIEAALADTPTADALWAALPLSEAAHTWGDEIYFSVPVQAGADGTSTEVVQDGDLCFWPDGSALCIFFGPTPISRPGEIRPAGAVNVFGRVRGDTGVLRRVEAGSTVVVEKGGQ